MTLPIRFKIVTFLPGIQGGGWAVFLTRAYCFFLSLELQISRSMLQIETREAKVVVTSKPCLYATQCPPGLVNIFLLFIGPTRERQAIHEEFILLMVMRANLRGRPRCFASLASADNERLVLTRHGGAGRG